MRNRKIFKYDLNIIGMKSQMVRVPKDAQFLHVGFQDHWLRVWALVDTVGELLIYEAVGS